MSELFSNYWWQLILVAFCSFALGGVNFAILFTRAIKHEDIRDVGSGNAGTTNVFRVFGLRMGTLTFVCDVLKGVLPCVACLLIFRADIRVSVEYWAGAWAVLGHIFPPMHKFKGGKGIATSMGVCLVTQPILTLCCVIPIFIVVFVVDRMSVVSLMFAIFMIVWHWTVLFDKIGLAPCIFLSVMFAFVIFAHRHNILRIVTGRELPTGVRTKLLRMDKRKNRQNIESTEADNAEIIEKTDAHLDENADAASEVDTTLNTKLSKSQREETREQDN